jgi:uncharacterized protein
MAVIQPDPDRLFVPLSDEEIEELDTFLMSDTTSEDTMMLDMVDGYLTAIVVGPTTILPSQWLPGIWGPSEDDAPEYESMEEAQRIVELLIRQTNGIIWSLQHDPEMFDPMFPTMTYGNDSREYIDGEGWSVGFIAGLGLSSKDWQPLFDDPEGKAALRPIALLGGYEPTEENEKLTRWPEQREELTKQIAASVASIYRFWLPHRKAAYEDMVTGPTERREPKVGRNELCPCGSGKKFKKCCGAPTTLH